MTKITTIQTKLIELDNSYFINPDHIISLWKYQDKFYMQLSINRSPTEITQQDYQTLIDALT